jgi:endonuclease G
MMDMRVLAVIFVVFAFACRRETVNPTLPTTPTQAEFSLVASGGNCSNTNVQGGYEVSVTTGINDFVIVQVNVSKPGKYIVTTPTVNGLSFADSGTFNSTGVTSIFLKAKGTPLAGGNFNYALNAGSSTCSFEVSVFDPSLSTIAENDHMYFGNPSDAAPIIDSANNYLMRKPYYSLSYSRDMGKPNWVSWHLYASDLGNTPRLNDFRPDVTLPAGWYQVPSYAFSGSGFDRGHNTPSADRTSSLSANSSTFLMTNMIPQAPNNNQQTWASLEDSLRRLVNGGSEVYIIMGNYGVGGTGSYGYVTTVDNGRVTVPAFIWKVAVVMQNGINDSARVNANTRVISILVPNDNNVSSNWKTYRTSIDVIEAVTGYNLLSRLPATLQAAIEAKVDNY